MISAAISASRRRDRGGVAGAAASRALGAAAADARRLLRFDALGNVTLLHVADIHGQLMPVYFREPSVNLGVGEAKGLPPHLTGAAFSQAVRHSRRGSAAAYALTRQDFAALARIYGRIGGLDRLATVIKAVRAERGAERVLLLDGGDTWQGSLTATARRGRTWSIACELLKPDAMTGHWEFTYGEARVKELIDSLGFPFLALNIRDTEWNEPVFEPIKMFEKGGVKVAVLGQAFPYTPVANPRWMMPKWSFGIREEDVRANVDKARRAGAQLVVLLSHNGFDVDRKLASRVAGIDVILTGHTHDALPEAMTVGKTLLIASGSHGKFLSRLDLDVRGGEVHSFRYKLIPLFADAIAPDAEMAAAIAKARAPFEAELARVVGQTESLLYRRGNFNGTFDDLICDAMLKERDAEIALSPGFRWGTSVLPGAADHRRGHPQRDRDHLSAGLSHGDERRAAQGSARRRRRQSVQPRSLLSAGRRHGALRRARLLDRRFKADRPAHFQHDAAQDRQADRAGARLHRGGLGQRQRRHPRPAGLGCGRALCRRGENGARFAQ